MCRFWKRKSVGVLTADGKTLNCRGYRKIKVDVGQVPAVNIEALVVDKQLLGFGQLLGIDAIKELGGAYLTESGEARFGGLNRCAAISIDEQDFSVTYDRSYKKWTASWRWANGHSPSELSNRVQEYAVSCHAKDSYENEILQWQRNGWLLPYSEEELGPPKGLILLMVVVQEQMQKVRLVLDNRELIGFVDAFTANAEVCAQKQREWRRQGVNVSLLDLRNAYLQIHVDKALWPFQTVIFRGQRFCLIRLGFGLNVALLIMKSVIDAVVSVDYTVKRATWPAKDDGILINENLVPASRVQQHFLDYGLVSSDPVRLRDGVRVLGLQVWEKDGTLRRKRGSQIPEIPDGLTSRRVFSLCGKLGHFPVCGWLRVPVAFIKRLATAVTKG